MSEDSAQASASQQSNAPKNDKAAARLVQRQKMVFEIVETEEHYVDALQVLFDGMF